MKTNLTFYKGLLGIFFVTLFLTTTALAQKCKVKNTFDEFTSITTVQGVSIVLGGELRLGRAASWDVSAGFMAKNDSLFIILTHSTSAADALHINEFSLKFDDGSFLTIKNGDFFGGGDQAFGYIAETTIFPITRMVLEKIASHAITKVKPTFSVQGEFAPEIEVKDKTAEQVQKNATCILDYKIPPTAKL